MFTAMCINFVPILGPANPMHYDTVAFYNQASAIVAGIVVGALSFRVLPPLSSAYRMRRLLALTLRDLRRLAMGRPFDDWREPYAWPAHGRAGRGEPAAALPALGGAFHWEPRSFGCVPSPAGSASAPSSKPRSPPWPRAGARLPRSGSFAWTRRLPRSPAPNRQGKAYCEPAAVLLYYRKCWPSMLPISTAERRHEPCRGQFVWRLCRADLRDDGRRLAGGDRITPSRRPFRPITLCLASGAVHGGHLHDRAVLDRAPRRARDKGPCPRSKPKHSRNKPKPPREVAKLPR